MNKQKKLSLDLLLQIVLSHADPYTEQELYAGPFPHAVAHLYAYRGPHPYEITNPNVQA